MIFKKKKEQNPCFNLNFQVTLKDLFIGMHTNFLVTSFFFSYLFWNDMIK